ncbi:HNH endonuclease [Caballeronia peredens]|nr:HNH endonuclease [Caballeronia peredens]
MRTPCTVEELRKMLSYDPETGELRWIDPKHIRRGQPAGWMRKHTGYRVVVIKQVRYLEHRICWALHSGEWPEVTIDHINHIKSDNRIANLRVATVAQNNRNRPRQANNSIGFKGVTQHRGSKRFHAKIQANNVKYSLGYFDSPEEAHAAYAAAAAKLHGEFHHE